MYMCIHAYMHIYTYIYMHIGLTRGLTLNPTPPPSPLTAAAAALMGIGGGCGGGGGGGGGEPPGVNPGWVSSSKRGQGGGFGVYKILFYFEAYVHESIMVYSATHPHCPHCCTTVARPLRNIRPPSPTPLLYAMHHTTWAMAISCKGQTGSGVTRVEMCGSVCCPRLTNRTRSSALICSAKV